MARSCRGIKPSRPDGPASVVTSPHQIPQQTVMRGFLLLGFVALAASAKLPLSPQSSGYNYQSPSNGGGFSAGQLGGASPGPFGGHGGQVGRPTSSSGSTGNQLGGSSAFFDGTPSATNIPSRPGVVPQGSSEGYNYERPSSGGSFSSGQVAGSHSSSVGGPSGSAGRPSLGAASSQFSQFDEPSTGFGGVTSASNIPNGLSGASQGLNNFGVVPSTGTHSGSAGGFGSSGSFGSAPTTTFGQQGQQSGPGGSSSGFGATGSQSFAAGGPSSSPFSGVGVSGGRPGGLPSTFGGPGGSTNEQAEFGAASSAAFSTLEGVEEFSDDFRPAATPEEQLANLENAVAGGGIPGEDFPILSEVPDTGFMCEDQAVSGYYADTAEEAGCQVFHICQIRESGLVQKDSFLCPNGTIFNQKYLVCDWWKNFDCSTAESLYSVNEQIGQVSSSGLEVQGFASGFSGPFGSVSDEGQLGGAGANQFNVFAGSDGFPIEQSQASAGVPTQFGGVPSGFGSQSSQFGGQPAQQGSQLAQFGGQPTQFSGPATQFGNQPSQFVGQAAQTGGSPGQQTSGQGQQPTLGGSFQPGSQTGQFGGQIGAGSSSSFAGVPSSASQTGQFVGGPSQIGSFQDEAQFGFSGQGQFANQVPSNQYLTPSVTSGTSSMGPGSGRPGAGSSSAGGPATGSSGAGRPGIGSSGAGRPGSGSTGAGRPGIESSGAGRPGTGSSGAGRPGTGSSGAGRPGAGSSSTGRPGTGSSGAGRPGTGSSGAGRPGTGSSGAGRPGIGSSGTGRPGTGSFGAGRPAAGSSSTGRPGAGKPSTGGTGIGATGAGRPGSGRPSGGRPSADESNSGRPSTGSPGAGRPAPSALYGAPTS